MHICSSIVKKSYQIWMQRRGLLCQLENTFTTMQTNQDILFTALVSLVNVYALFNSHDTFVRFVSDSYKLNRCVITALYYNA